MTKACTKCKIEKPINDFHKHKLHKDGMTTQCKVCIAIGDKEYRSTAKGKEVWKASGKRYMQDGNGRQVRQEYRVKNKTYIDGRNKEYHATINGYLHVCFSNVKRRCSGNSTNPKDKCYVEMGIQNKFKNSQEFVDYVINVLKVDPRGLQVDRIGNNGHYEKGNIRFVTAKENNNNKRNNKNRA